MDPQAQANEPPDSSLKVDLLGVTARALSTAAVGWFGDGKGQGFARDVHRQAVLHGQFAPEELGAGPRSAAVWRAQSHLHLPKIIESRAEQGDYGEICKRLLQLYDGRVIESVSIPMGRNRCSLCVSTQVGCARACTFCETGKLGLLRNLSAGEIVAQVTTQLLAAPISHVVFQGMGEPLDNLEGLLPALEVLSDPSGIGLGHDRMTVCTVGHVPGIEALRKLGWKRLGLSLSLNSADDKQRSELMPRSVRYRLVDIQAALVAYRQRKNMALGIHWCLIPGVNDTARDADQIAAFLAPLGRTLVHVIPYNPGSVPISRPPTDREIVAFVMLLRQRGVAVRRRITKGRTVMAGCGQLGKSQSSD